jgi:hypothetical protein
MSNIAMKLRIGTAACAVATAAALTPVPAAQAVPVAPAPSATGLGSTLGSTACILGVFNPGQCAGGAATFGNLFYLGGVDSTPPPRTDFLKFNPTPLFLLIPILGVPLASWWNSLDIEVCVGGLSARIGGPYHDGNLTASIGSGC